MKRITLITKTNYLIVFFCLHLSNQGGVNTVANTIKNPNLKEEATNTCKKSQPKPQGSLSGKILDEQGLPIYGATVVLAGTHYGIDANENGDFILRGVPEGTYTAEVSFIGYFKLLIQDVSVKEGKNTSLNVVLKEDMGQLEEVVITMNYAKASAEGLYNRQKNMISLSDGVSADMISKTSDNNVGEVLKRVSGIVMENGGKFVNIRGLGNRYNNMQLNGSSLPATEANSKNFSFDMIPSNLIDNVVINKTFTPDLPAEFVGGLVNVSTLSIPKKTFFNFTAGTGINTKSYNKDFWSGKRYNADYFTGNMDDRNWYGTIFKPDLYQQWGDKFNDLDLKEDIRKENLQNMNEMNSQVPNTWGLKRYTGSPNTSYALSFGNPFYLKGGSTLGIITAVSYRNEQETEELEEAHFRSYGNRSYGGTRHTFSTWLGALANLGWETDGHKIVFSNLFNNKFTDVANRRFLQNANSALFLEQSSVPIQSQLFQTKLEGEHRLTNQSIKLAWSADYNKVNRLSPDERSVEVNIAYKNLPFQEGSGTGDTANLYFPLYTSEGEVITDGKTWGAITDGNAFGEGYIRHNKYEEDKKNAGLNLEFPFIINNQKQTVKIGYYGTFRKSHYEQLSLRPINKYTSTAHDPRKNSDTVEEFFSEDRFKSGFLSYNPYFGRSNTSRLRDSYAGNQRLHAAYINTEFSFFGKLKLSGGIRIEDNKMEVLTAITRDNDGKDTVFSNINTKFFPSITAMYNIIDDFNIRAAFSKTIARPDFNEISSISYYDIYERSQVKSAKIIDTQITNYDVRLEWYPAPREVISLGGFYKEFTDPVEMLSRALQGGNYDFYKSNIASAKLRGLEFNIRKSFGFLNPDSFLKDLFIGGNLTILEGSVEYDLEKMKEENQGFTGDPENYRHRPLQGLAPSIYNGSLAYEGAVLGAAVNYGRVGRRVVITGPRAYLDEFEDARNVLDFQISGRLFNNSLEVKANLNDVLNEPIVKYINSGYGSGEDVDLSGDLSYNQGIDRVRSRYRKGVSASLSFTYKF